MVHIVAPFSIYPESTSAVTLYDASIKKQAAVDEMDANPLEEAGGVHL
jgi:hypothetical protein